MSSLCRCRRSISQAVTGCRMCGCSSTSLSNCSPMRRGGSVHGRELAKAYRKRNRIENGAVSLAAQTPHPDSQALVPAIHSHCAGPLNYQPNALGLFSRHDLRARTMGGLHDSTEQTEVTSSHADTVGCVGIAQL